MFFHLFAVIAVGFACAGCVMLTIRCFNKKASKFVYLSAAGIGMITYNIWEEYSWFDRHAEAMEAEGKIIVQSYGEGMVWQPWTYVYPRVTRFLAWEPDAPLRPTQSNLQYGSLHLVARRADVVVVPQVYDCDQKMSAELLNNTVVFDDTGRPSNLRWVQLDGDDPILTQICS